MSFDRFLLAVESRDLSQADKSMIKLTKTSIFPNCQVPNSFFFGITVNFIIQKAFGKKTLLKYFCQLEIDHVTQQPKETCQGTCRGPRMFQQN